MGLLDRLISDQDIRTIESHGARQRQSCLSGEAHRAMSEADPRVRLYVELVRNRLQVPEDATAAAMRGSGVPSVGDIVEHLAERGVHRLALTRPRAWKANRKALREAEGE